MAKHKLYEDALRIYRLREDRIEGLMDLYAEYLLKEAKYKEAGIGMYKSIMVEVLDEG